MKDQIKQVVYSAYQSICKIITEKYPLAPAIYYSAVEEHTYVTNAKIDGMILGVVSLACEQLQAINKRDEFFYNDQMRAFTHSIVTKTFDYPKEFLKPEDLNSLVEKLLEYPLDVELIKIKIRTEHRIVCDAGCRNYIAASSPIAVINLMRQYGWKTINGKCICPEKHN